MSSSEEPTPRIVVGFWRRFLADALDSLMLGVAGYAIAYPFRYSISRMGLHALWFGLVSSFLYFGILHTSVGGGQTPGKRLLGIQVLARNGDFLSFGKSLIRYLAVSLIFYNKLYMSLLLLLPLSASTLASSVLMLVLVWAFLACFLLIPFHPLKRGLHDIAAGSVVVYKGCYDAASLDQMEDPGRAARALWGLTGVTLVVSALFAAAFFSFKPASLGELSILYTTLGHEYDVRGVREVRSNGGPPVLFVDVFLPMNQYEDKAVRSAVEDAIQQEVRTNFHDVDRYRDVRVMILSGYDLGITNIKLSSVDR